MMINYTENQLEAIAIIESLRSGIPTMRSTRNLPDLRPELMKLVEKDLNSLKNKSIVKGRIIWGPYGDGKSHLLTSIEHKALSLNMAVSKISLSRNVTCNNFSKLYYYLASRVRTPDSVIMGIQRYLNQKKREEFSDSQIAKPNRYSHPFFSYIFEDYLAASGEEQEIIYNFLVGGRPFLNELKKIHKSIHKVPMEKFERNFSFKEDSNSFFDYFSDILTFLGFDGWIILIDELELVSRLSKNARLDTYLNLNKLLNWSDDLNCPIYVICAAAQSLQSDLWFSSHLKRNDKDLMPDLAKEKYKKEAVNIINNFFNFAIDKEICPIIKPVELNVLLELLLKIKDIYERAFNKSFYFDMKEFIGNFPSDTTIRTYIRALIEKLDILRVHDTDVEVRAGSISGYSINEDAEYFSEEDLNDI
ncbi:BREX system ATP-binding domain-containing protein [Thermodesulfobium sp. 4217-1]|uniref:BREX system ATP-binding domain-containing protein n=1 Tax=Thermodesulfobium sp. 4217-1 TaxID=3120013 RepID=UPI00322171A2